MSGPWDRPSSPDPDDRDSAAQDRESPPDNAQSAEPRAPTDPWGESSSSEPGWDVWPPPSPPPDDYYSEPDSSHDLWSEPWEEEAAAMGAGAPDAAYEPAPLDPPVLEPAPAETAPLEQPAAPAFDEPEPYEPEPHAPEPDEPEPYEPEPVTPEPAAPEPYASEPVVPEPAHIDRPAADLSEPELPEPEPPAARPEPYRGVPYEPEPHEPSFDAPGPADDAEGTWEHDAPDRPPWAAAAAAGVTGATVLPDWLAEPLPEWPARDLGDSELGEEASPDAEPAEAEPAEAEPAEEIAEPAGWLDVGASAAAAAQVIDDPGAAPEPIEDEPPAEPATTEAEDDDAGAGWGVAGLAAAGVAAARPEAPVEEPPVATPEQEREPEPEPPSEEIELEAGAESEAESGWPPPFLETDELTRVLPTDWTAPPVTPREPEAELEPEAGEARTVAGAEPESEAEVEPGSTAEQAVPWLIGLVLLLAGMVIVLLALIFAGDGSLGGETPQPSVSLAAAVPTASATPVPSVASSAPSASAAPAPTPTPVPAPVYGPLEMVYQGRAAALAPIYLLLHDFTTGDEAMVLAQDPTIDVRRFAWAPDGTVGAGLLADVLVSIEIGESKRNLGEDLATLTFGPDALTVYAVRVTPDGGDDTATILAVDFASGESSELASVTYTRPQIGSEPALQEAQFTDEGGTIRLFWMHDGSLRLWVLGASTWTIDPESGEASELDDAPLPILRDPEGTHAIVLEVADDASTTTLHYRNLNGNELESTSAPGLVSHLRWSPNGDRIVFTVGRSASGGGVLQDLFLWDLDSEAPPMQITNTGAAFGAEWRGTMPRWEDA